MVTIVPQVATVLRAYRRNPQVIFEVTAMLDAASHPEDSDTRRYNMALAAMLAGLSAWAHDEPSTASDFFKEAGEAAASTSSPTVQRLCQLGSANQGIAQVLTVQAPGAQHDAERIRVTLREGGNLLLIAVRRLERLAGARLTDIGLRCILHTAYAITMRAAGEIAFARHGVNSAQAAFRQTLEPSDKMRAAFRLSHQVMDATHPDALRLHDWMLYTLDDVHV